MAKVGVSAIIIRRNAFAIDASVPDSSNRTISGRRSKTFTDGFLGKGIVSYSYLYYPGLN